jgi:hypothetical protein
LRDRLADLLDLKPVLLYFGLKLNNGGGAILKPFAALISYMPEFRLLGTIHRVSARRSPFDVLVSTLKFIRTSAEFLGHLLRLRQLGIKFGLRGLMFSIKEVNRSLAF